MNGACQHTEMGRKGSGYGYGSPLARVDGKG